MLEVAGRVFAAHGFHDASMDEIAQDAGISKPMIYNYFGSKEGLYFAYIELAGQRLLSRMLRRSSLRSDLRCFGRIQLLSQRYYPRGPDAGGGSYMAGLLRGWLSEGQRPLSVHGLCQRL